MNGQLREHPPAELIRELSLKNLSGKLQLQHEKLRVAVYFQSGKLSFAACNAQTFRLGPYLVKGKLVTEEDLHYLGKKRDFELARTLIAEKRITTQQAQRQQAKLVADILRTALLWTEGSWEFDNRAHLNEEVKFRVDVERLLVESARHLPPNVISTRFKNPKEIFSPVELPEELPNLTPTEVFLLSRVDSPLSLSDLVAVSGLPENDVLRVLYSLTLAGLIKREYWKTAFRDLQGTPETKAVEPPKIPEKEAPEEKSLDETIESFLTRLAAATSHYEVLNVPPRASMPDLKAAYYDIARNYHPDRFRSSKISLLGKIESAFARITQAYDTLRDPGQRATYDSKLEAQARAAKLAQAAPKATNPTDQQADSTVISEEYDDDKLTPGERAELQFKDGFAALELGQRNVALGLLGSAARAFPTEPRYRAYYGRSLAMHETTRRLAEAEFLAAIKLEPRNSEYRMMLAELYRDLGFLVRAKGEAERAVAADKNNRKARELLRSLS